MACNTCYCKKKSLICTKIACIDWKPPKRNNSSKTLKVTLRKGKPKSPYPELPNGPCEPGKLYKKDRTSFCFCDGKQKAVCSKHHIHKKETVYETLKAIHPLFKSPSDNKLPSLLSQAAKCEPGEQYKVDCNFCVCLHNNNLMCTKMLCLSYDDMNRIEAKKHTGLPCTELDKVTSDCIKCRCMKNKLDCEQLQGCVSTHLKKKLSHGGSPPKLSLNMKSLKDQKCIDYSIYRDNCNLCFCRKGTLRCTQKSCLKYRQVLQFQKQRLYLEQHGL